MNLSRIPFNRASFAGREAEFIAEAIRNQHISGDGPFTRACHNFLERELGVTKAFLTTSCTHALEMAALLLDIGPGDEVILPSFTFVSTVNAFALRGAKPVFADIRPDTLNLDERRLESLITERTKAIAVVHYAGVGCAMDEISAIAESRNIAVVEDNAHGLFGKYRGRQLGTIGCLATQSFHETKNFTCGEGGALLVNDSRYVESAEIIREKGTNRGRFFRGEVDKYSWVSLGSSYLPSDVLAAFLLAQFENHAAIQARRAEIWKYYDSALRSWAERRGVGLPVVPLECEQAYHMYYMIMPSLKARTAFIAYLREREIISVFHYVPLHLSDMGRKYGSFQGACPVTEDVSDRLVRLPFYNDLSNVDLERVIEVVRSVPASVFV